MHPVIIMLTAKEIVKFIISRSAHPLKLKEMARELDIPQKDYSKFRKLVKLLLDEGRLVNLKRGRIGAPDQLNVMVGQISINRSGTGFFVREEEEDIIIRPIDLMTALDGDRVMIRATGSFNGRDSGQVIKIVERPERNIVGVYHKSQAFAYVVPDNPRLHKHFYIPPNASKRAKEGEKVVARLVDWQHPAQNPQAKIIERLGFPGDPGVDMLGVVRAHNFTLEFPGKVLAEAERSAAVDIREAAARRVDFCSDPVCTIDPVDAKDFDDAIFVKRTSSGYRVGVHIADVSHFVKEEGLLDKEALARGTSVYLPGMVIPMLPEVLSNDVCSLRPNRIRLAHSAIMDFDRSGRMVGWEIVDSVIKSRARLTYEEVQEYFDAPQTITPKIKRVKESLDVARELALKLTARRLKAGSLDFALPESKIVMDSEGEVTELGLKKRLEVHRLVEEFMLSANQAVALEVFRKGLPFLYRVHARPDMDRLEAFSEMMGRLGHKFPVSPTMKPIQFARFLDHVAQLPESEFINELLLRSMQKAVYQRENVGHFGLAFKHYAHFTSPIRRYPDLLVHRLLRKCRKGKYPPKFARTVTGLIDHVGSQCSEMERGAVAAEREAIKIKQLAYMERHVGDEFSGLITGVMPFGFFVRLNDFGVEGLVRLSSIDDDYYAYEEGHYRIRGRRTGQTYRLGDPVRVQVVRLDRMAAELDFRLLESSSSSGKKSNKSDRVKRSKYPSAKKNHPARIKKPSGGRRRKRK